MTIQELSRLRALSKLMEREREKLEELRAAAVNTSPRIDGMPHGSGPHDKIGDLTIRIVDQEDQILQHIRQYYEEWQQINTWINNVSDPRIRLICLLRFCDGLPWEEVADRIGGRETSNAAINALRRYLTADKEGG